MAETKVQQNPGLNTETKIEKNPHSLGAPKVDAANELQKVRGLDPYKFTLDAHQSNAHHVQGNIASVSLNANAPADLKKALERVNKETSGLVKKVDGGVMPSPEESRTILAAAALTRMSNPESEHMQFQDFLINPAKHEALHRETQKAFLTATAGGKTSEELKAMHEFLKSTTGRKLDPQQEIGLILVRERLDHLEDGKGVIAKFNKGTQAYVAFSSAGVSVFPMAARPDIEVAQAPVQDPSIEFGRDGTERTFAAGNDSVNFASKVFGFKK